MIHFDDPINDQQLTFDFIHTSNFALNALHAEFCNPCFNLEWWLEWNEVTPQFAGPTDPMGDQIDKTV